MYGKDMGVDVGLNQADLLAHLVAEEMSLGEVTTLLKLRRGQFSLIEEKVHPDSRATGRTIAELALPPGCVVVAVIRKGELLVGGGGVQLQPADEVLAVVHADHLSEVASLLGPSV
jgi:trk system potassium uptake protein TrkA